MAVESMVFKKKPKRLKRAITLIEMIVVLMILTMITGALAYNYKKSIDEGKKFKATEMTARIKTLVEIAIAEGRITRNNIATEWEKEVVKSPLIQSSEKFLKDAKEMKFVVSAGDETAEDTLPVKVEHS